MKYYDIHAYSGLFKCNEISRVDILEIHEITNDGSKKLQTEMSFQITVTPDYTMYNIYFWDKIFNFLDPTYKISDSKHDIQFNCRYQQNCRLDILKNQIICAQNSVFAFLK